MRSIAAALLAAVVAVPAAAQSALAPAPVATASDAQAAAPSGLTLDSAVDLFLRRNASLEAARLEVGTAAAERVAAGLRPRPGLTASIENVPIGGDTSFSQIYEVTVSVAQPIQLGNRLDRRRAVAERTVAVAEARLAETLRRRLSDLKRTYYEALLARALSGIEREVRDHFGELVEYNTVRLEEGEIAEGDLIKVRLERVRYDSAVTTAELAYRQAKIRLLEHVGETALEGAASLEVAGELKGRGADLDLAALRQAALANRPEVKVGEAQLALADAQIALERSIAKGEITPFAGYRRVGPVNAVVGGVTVPLPFGDRNQGGIVRAEAERRVAEATLKAARARALADVEAAFRAYETARAQVLAYEREILDQADESRDIQLAAYREGVVPLLTVMEAERTRADARSAYSRALFDYRMSLVALELATGTEIQG
jgi:cobalt-zinc-cadmium efflux system outer membrane protein